MVFQNYALYPHMTVRENMGFALKLAKAPRDEIGRKVDEAAWILGIEEHLDRKPAHLSGGQRQRVAMGRAIVRNPKAFLMDEPLPNLDAKLRVRTRTEIALLQQRLGTTMIYVTHDQIEALTLGDRIAVLRAGALQQVGTPADLYGHPENVFVAGFIGSPSMNFLPERLDGETLRIAIGDIPISDRLRRRLESGEWRRDGREVIVGIRPEQFEDATLVGDRSRGGTFTTEVDALESMGSEYYAHLRSTRTRSACRACPCGSACASGSKIDTSRSAIRSPRIRLRIWPVTRSDRSMNVSSLSIWRNFAPAPRPRARRRATTTSRLASRIERSTSLPACSVSSSACCLRSPVRPPKRAGHRPHAAADRSRAIPHMPRVPADLRQKLARLARQHPSRVERQPRVGRVAHVRLDHGRVDPDRPRPEPLLPPGLVDHHPGDLVHHLGAEPARQLAHRRLVRRPLPQRDQTEAAQMQRVRHLPHQRLIPPAGPLLDHHQPHIRRHRDRRPAMSPRLLLPVRLDRRQQLRI